MRLIRSDTAVSNIIGAVLILALLITVVAAVKVVYVPDMKKEAESVHMQNVIQDLQDFKTQVSTIQAASTNGNGFTASSSLEMGGGALPMIDPSLSSGTVTVDPGYGNFSITAYSNNRLLTDNDSMIFTRGPAPMGRLAYSSNNHYYVDQQISYEGGMIVMTQIGGKTVLSSPPISVTRVTNDPNTTAIVAINPTRIAGSPQSLSSTGTSTLRTTMLPANNVINTNKVTNVTIKVQSNNSDLWYSYFEQLMNTSGLTRDTNYVLTMQDPQTVSLRINGSGVRDDVVLSSIDSLVITQIDGGLQQMTLPMASASPSPSPSSSPSPSPSPGPVHHFGIVPGKTTVQVNEDFTVTVTAYDVNNNVVPSYSSTVSLSLDHSQGHLEGPSDHTFVPATDAGVYTFTNVYFRSGSSSPYKLKVTDSSGKQGTSVDITVIP